MAANKISKEERLRQIRETLKASKASASRNAERGRTKGKVSREMRTALKLKKGETVSKKFPDETRLLAKKLEDVIPDAYADDKGMPKSRLALAAAKKMMGDSISDAAKQVGVNVKLVSDLFNIKFPKAKEMDQMLEEVLLTNANLASAVFAQKAHELSPRDAAMAAGVFTKAYLEKKSEREGRDRPAVPVVAIIQLEKVLKRVEGKVIEHKKLTAPKTIDV